MIIRAMPKPRVIIYILSWFLLVTSGNPFIKGHPSLKTSLEAPKELESNWSTVHHDEGYGNLTGGIFSSSPFSNEAMDENRLNDVAKTDYHMELSSGQNPDVHAFSEVQLGSEERRGSMKRDGEEREERTKVRNARVKREAEPSTTLDEVISWHPGMIGEECNEIERHIIKVRNSVVFIEDIINFPLPDTCFRSIYQNVIKDAIEGLHPIGDSHRIIKAMTSCTDFVGNHNVRFFAYTNLHENTFYLPYLDTSSGEGGNVALTVDLFQKCKRDLDRLQQLSNDRLNISLHIPVTDLKFFLLPTIPWACEPKLLSNHTYQFSISIALRKLWMRDNVLPQVCGQFTGRQDPDSYHIIFLISPNMLDSISNCANFASKVFPLHDKCLFAFDFSEVVDLVWFWVDKVIVVQKKVQEEKADEGEEDENDYEEEEEEEEMEAVREEKMENEETEEFPGLPLDALGKHCAFMEAYIVAIKNSIIITRENPIKDIYFIDCLFNIVENKIIDAITGLHYGNDSLEVDSAIESCHRFLYSPFLNMKGKKVSYNRYYWFLYINFDSDDKGSIDDTKISLRKCMVSLDQLQNTLLNEHLKPSPLYPVTDLKFFLLPTIPWECLVHRYLTNTESRIISNSLLDLWILNSDLPQLCGKLTCYYALPPKYLLFFIPPHDNFSDCKIRSSKSVTIDGREYFAFFPNHLKTVIAFQAAKSRDANETEIATSTVNELPIGQNGSVNRCCSHILSYKFEVLTANFVVQTYHFCQGSSKSCLQENGTWHIGRVGDGHYMVAMNERLVATSAVQSNNILQRLIYLNSSVSPSLYQWVLSLQSFKYSVILTLYDEADLFKINRTQEKRLTETISKMKYPCRNEEHSIVCSDGLLMNRYATMFFSYVNETCPLIHQAQEKLYALLNGRVFGISRDDVCPTTTSVIMVDLARQNIPFLESYHYYYSECADLGIRNVGGKGIGDNCNKLIDERWNGLNRFEAILIYPRYLSKDLALKQLLSERGKSITDKRTIDITIVKDKIGIKRLNVSDFGGKGVQESPRSLEMTLSYFLIASLTDNTQCLSDLSDDRFSVVVQDDSDRPRFTAIGPIPSDVTETSCLSILPINTYNNIEKGNKTRQLTINKFWPVCWPNMAIIFEEARHNRTIVFDFDYLSSPCKILEIVLFSMMCVVTAVATLGNVTVLTMLILTGLVKKKSFIIHTSLAIADLLQGFTGLTLAVYDTLSLMDGSLTLYDLAGKGIFENFYLLTFQQTRLFQQLRFRRQGWPAASAVLMSTSLLASILTMFLFSAEILYSLKKHPVKCVHMRLAMGVIWIFSFISSIGVNYRNDGFLFVGFFDPITKLTLNIATDTGSWSFIAQYLQIFVSAGAGIFILAFLFNAIIILRTREHRLKRTTAVCGKQHEMRVRHFTHTMLLMVMLFIISSLSVVVDLNLNFATSASLVHFLLWWIFMAASSWNWIIYTTRDQYFKDETKKFFKKGWRRAKEVFLGEVVSEGYKVSHSKTVSHSIRDRRKCLNNEQRKERGLPLLSISSV